MPDLGSCFHETVLTSGYIKPATVNLCKLDNENLIIFLCFYNLYPTMQTRVIFKLSCLLVMVDDSCLRGHGFKSRRRTLVGHDIFHIELLWGLYCSFEKTENKNEKEAGVGPFFKKTFQTKLNRKTRLQRASSSLWRNS